MPPGRLSHGSAVIAAVFAALALTRAVICSGVDPTCEKGGTQYVVAITSGWPAGAVWSEAQEIFASGPGKSSSVAIASRVSVIHWMYLYSARPEPDWMPLWRHRYCMDAGAHDCSPWVNESVTCITTAKDGVDGDGGCPWEFYRVVKEQR